MKPTLLLLAAGMGSRYGGLKQLDGLGPNGETIMDYSIYDAIQAGFGKIVWVIRKDFEQDFREKILSKYEGHVPCELCFQSIEDLPEGFKVPEGRQKPWGTNHAVLMAKDIIKEPFCVINCDDFYNRDCFKVIGKFLSELPEGSKNRYAMVGFRVGNTLSENGTVARGICSKDANENLQTVVERTEIERHDGNVQYKDENGEWVTAGDPTSITITFPNKLILTARQDATASTPVTYTDVLVGNQSLMIIPQATNFWDTTLSLHGEETDLFGKRNLI